MAEQAKVPAIRFAGFTDPWEQRKLGEVATIVGGGTPSTNNDAYWDGDIDWYSPAELGEQVYAERSARRITQAGYDSCSATLLPAGKTILFTSRAGIGNTAILRRSACTNQGFQSLVVNDDTDVYFVYSMTDRIKKFAERKASGSTFLEISGKGLAAGEFAFPSKDEQTAIGSMFKQLDFLITLHQRKYDKLVVFKKSMLEKMFPKDGESVPEIRFAGFTDPWEQRKLSEVATFGGGHTPPMADPDNYEDGYVLWVTSQDVKSNYLDRTTTQITEKGAKELTLYPAGSLVMVTRSGILRHTLPVAELRKPSTVNQDIRVILPQGECCGEWLLQFFISHNKELLLEFGKTGTTVESVDFGKIKDMLLYMPSTVEQQQIGDYFAKLDDLITLHQRKLELLQNIKKSLLDKMFV
ncbi:restriction endonuclease subunit S [Bifidobacterium bifidum]|uniref:restriction endonuclease subunit S n=2 Tax=Bifidobacterium bifidum TaxID=1681 RepID=UPI00232AA1A9|nr:restriction endonuclease subunit S [Bifidobacterium bifidum]MDB1258372.1 restriction endonuclease subunit S [Bifidobacterium bifidum]